MVFYYCIYFTKIGKKIQIQINKVAIKTQLQ